VTPIAHFRARLLKRTGATDKCPAHDDNRGSLSHEEGEDGRVLVICHAGCSVNAVVTALGLTMRDLFPQERRPNGVASPRSASSRRIIATYDYTDERGTLLFQVVRFDPKDFKQRRPDGNGGCIWNLKGVRHVLYHLPALIAADPASPVYIVEGEKDVHAIEKIELVATTNAGGAGKWLSDYNEALRGRRIVILPDNDEPGRKHAKNVRQAVVDVAASVQIVNLPDVPPKGDVSDWLAAGGTRQALEALVAKTDDPSLLSPISHDEPIEWADPRPWPTLKPAALHGLAGELVAVLDPHTEADPAAVLVTTLVLFGNAVGDRPHVRVGGVQHPAREFACIVGDTSKARKGQSLGDTAPFFEVADPEWWEAARESGLSSGEGIVARLRDRDDGAPTDKRAIFIEPEFARTLAAAQRDKSTLSAVLRDAWDTGRLRVLTRNDPLKATGAHVGVLAHVTRDELRSRLTLTEVGNGFANRFLFIAVKRSKRLPDGGRLPAAAVERIGGRVREALGAARARDAIGRTPSAGARWEVIYNALPEPPGLFGALTARAEPHILRLSLIYALLDGAGMIDLPHVEAALALWNYASASAAYVFVGMLGSDTADRLLTELRDIYPQGLDRTTQNALFGRHRTEAELKAARKQLLDAGLAEERPERPHGGIGRDVHVLYAVPRRAKEAKDAKEVLPAADISLNSLLSHGKPPVSDGEVWL
jgi:hypothetical protein